MIVLLTGGDASEEDEARSFGAIGAASLSRLLIELAFPDVIRLLLKLIHLFLAGSPDGVRKVLDARQPRLVVVVHGLQLLGIEHLVLAGQPSGHLPQPRRDAFRLRSIGLALVAESVLL